MTSQLVLLNGHGAAIASDSAVTIGEKRTYETAEKIIPLPSPHLLAVLHAGSVNIHGMPYSVLVNEWAASLGSTRLRTTTLYMQNFVSWLNDNHSWATHKRTTNDFMRQLSDVYRRIWDDIKNTERVENLIGDPAERCLKIWTNWTEKYSRRFSLTDGKSDWAAHSFKKFKPEIDQGKEYWFNDTPMNEAIAEQIDAFTLQYLERGHHIDRSQLTFVGFGDKKLLSSYVRIEISGFVNESLLHRIIEEETEPDVESDNVFRILPIGQSDAIDRFLLGYADVTVDLAHDAAMDVFLSPEVAEGEENTVREPAPITDEEMRLSARVHEAIETAFDKWSSTNFRAPLFGAIAALPLASLATAARSLIEIQSLSQTITGEMGTVGGPIDVAVISRDKGFQWINHKSITS